VKFCGEAYSIEPGESLTLGREADVVIDDNGFLHRRFLMVEDRDGFWFLHNVGSQLGATVSDSNGAMEAFLAPGASIPLAFQETTVVFTAGPTTYEVEISTDGRAFSAPVVAVESGGGTTIGSAKLTTEQMVMVLSLAESRLRRSGGLGSTLPSSQEAASRLGWGVKKFNRKLDNVCDKLDRLGVRGLRGDVSSYASNRRARLVEYAVATRLVTGDDLPLLDRYVAEHRAVVS
jgi:hypothetical protein